jgi:GNAT superfamily N-acetyltransferase
MRRVRADDGYALVGFATVYLELVSVRFGQRALVEDLAVGPDRRSTGVDKALLDAAKDCARDQAANTSSSNPVRQASTHRFYEREQPAVRSRSFT